MLFALILIPLGAAVAILLGSSARLTALGAALANVAATAAFIGTNRQGNWDTGFQVLESPNINLSLGLYDGMSIVMLVLSVLVTLAAVYSGKCPAYLSWSYWCIHLYGCIFLLRLSRTRVNPHIPYDWYPWQWRP